MVDNLKMKKESIFYELPTVVSQDALRPFIAQAPEASLWEKIKQIINQHLGAV